MGPQPTCRKIPTRPIPNRFACPNRTATTKNRTSLSTNSGLEWRIDSLMSRRKMRHTPSMNWVPARTVIFEPSGSSSSSVFTKAGLTHVPSIFLIWWTTAVCATPGICFLYARALSVCKMSFSSLRMYLEEMLSHTVLSNGPGPGALRGVLLMGICTRIKVDGNPRLMMPRYCTQEIGLSPTPASIFDRVTSSASTSDQNSLSPNMIMSWWSVTCFAMWILTWSKNRCIVIPVMPVSWCVAAIPNLFRKQHNMRLCDANGRAPLPGRWKNGWSPSMSTLRRQCRDEQRMDHDLDSWCHSS